jgi:hypothetical protein
MIHWDGKLIHPDLVRRWRPRAESSLRRPADGWLAPSIQFVKSEACLFRHATRLLPGAPVY